MCACSNIQSRHQKESEYKEMAENSSWRTLLCLDLFVYISIYFFSQQRKEYNKNKNKVTLVDREDYGPDYMRRNGKKKHVNPYQSSQNQRIKRTSKGVGGERQQYLKRFYCCTPPKWTKIA